MDRQFDFPKIEWWRENVLIENDSKRFFKQHYYEYYLGKYMVCRMFGPQAIAEVGVRWGYSAFSFLQAAPQASYTGYDLLKGGYGGAKVDTYDWVYEMLSRHFPQAKRISLRHRDTRQLETLGGPYDFVHIDGNHREEACYHDIDMAMTACRAGGVVLVDDYVKVDGVKRAVDSYVKKNAGQIGRYFRMPSLTGEFILVRK